MKKNQLPNSPITNATVSLSQRETNFWKNPHLKFFENLLDSNRKINWVFKMLSLITFLFCGVQGGAQTYVCGVHQKARPVNIPENYKLDRFGNIYTEEELMNMYMNSYVMDCSNTGPFNVLIEPTTYLGVDYPTVDQEILICDVFSYLGGIIQAPGNGGTVNIHIIFDPALVGSQNAGGASPLFNQQCGIGYSNVQVQLNAPDPNLPPDFIHGYMIINPEYDWYTELGLMPPITNSQTDLYTTVLHEALHLLGFGSGIGASGNAINGFFTTYDLGLGNSAGQNMVLASNSPGDCCKEYEFNTTAFPNMPDDILQCGDVRFGVPQIPPVHGVYNFTPPLADDGTAANILSHLNITCGSGEDYVMHAQITSGAVNMNDNTTNIRRFLTSTEINIICALGYDVGSSCNAGCFLIVRDDGPFVLHEPTEILLYSSLTANDFDAAGNYDITFDFNCGDVGNMTFTTNNQTGEIIIDLNSTPYGHYEFCYTITSCNGDLCESGEVVIIVAESVDPSVCPVNDCNLVGYGDFEVFPVEGSIYYPSLAAPWNADVIIVDPIDPLGFFSNTVDIFWDGNNQFARVAECDICGNENLLAHLCAEIPEGCGTSIDFDACADGFPQIKTLGVWALSQLPIGLELPNTVVCNGELLDNGGNSIGTCLGQYDLSYGGSPFPYLNPPNFTHYSIPLPNGLDHPIKYLWFWGYDNTSGVTAALIDNIEITTDCQNKVTLTSTVVEACIGDQAVIEITVCLNGPINTPADVVIEPQLQSIPGISLSNVNPDFPNGIAAINDIDPGECPTVMLYLDISGNFQPGTEITFPLNIEVTGACIEDPNGQDVTMTLEECTPLDCDCPTNSIPIGTPNGETLLSTIVGTGTNNLPTSPTNPINMILQGTLVIDADVFTGIPGYYNFPAGSQICLAPGAAIRVASDNELEISGGTYIRGCTARWQAIEVEPGGRLTLDGTAGRISVEDGQYAVLPRAKSSVYLYNTDFTDNYTGLLFDGTDGGFALLRLAGCTFEGLVGLLPHYDPGSTDDGPWAYAGIQVANTSFLNIPGHNTFQHIRNGILGENSTIRVNSFNHFDRITAQDQDYTIAGRAIRLASGNGREIQVIGCTFSRCDWGVQAIQAKVGAVANTMTTMLRGIEVLQGINMKALITNNTITATERCVFLSQTDGAYVNITDNTFNIVGPVIGEQPTPPISIALDISEGGAVHPLGATVEDNTITTDGDLADGGIRILRGNGYHVLCNDVTATGDLPDFYAGINLNSCTNLMVVDNAVAGPGGSAGTNAPVAMQVRNTQNTTYNNNDLGGMPIGLQFNQGCTGTKLIRTDFGANDWNLHYQATASTGPQPFIDLSLPNPSYTPYSNSWSGSGVGAKHDANFLAVIQQSRYTVQSLSIPLHPVSVEVNIGTADDWFRLNTNTQGTLPGLYCYEVDPTCCYDKSIGDLEERIAKGDFATDGYEGPLTWAAERYLYDLLRSDNELLSAGSVYEEFYAQQAGTTIEAFADMEASMEPLFVLDENDQAELEALTNQLEAVSDALIAIEGQLATAAGQTLENLLEDWSEQSDLLEAAGHAHQVFVQTVGTQRAGLAQSLLPVNEAISASEVYELNERAVNRAVLRSVADGALSQEQYDVLMSVAVQCPYSGGTAVFRARSILAGYTNALFDDSACEGSPYQRPEVPGGAVTVGENLAFSVQPNPATGDFAVIAGAGTDVSHEREVVLCDIHGRVVRTGVLKEGDNQLTFVKEGLPTGIYWVKVSANGKILFADKVVVQ